MQQKQTVRTIFITTVLPVMIFCWSYSCKKGDGPGTQPKSCKLASLLVYPAGQAQQTVSFQYDHEGRVKFINQDGAINEYIYQGDAFIRVRPGGSNGWVTRSYIQLNTEGLPSIRKDTIYNNQHINNTGAITYEYNSRGELEKGTSNSSLIPNLSITWQNGNMISITEGNTTMLLDYHTDKPDQDLSIMGLKFLIEFGAYTPKSKNLLKSVSSGGQQINFNYEFDAKGKIKAATWTVAGNPTPVATWQQVYDCD